MGPISNSQEIYILSNSKSLMTKLIIKITHGAISQKNNIKCPQLKATDKR